MKQKVLLALIALFSFVSTWAATGYEVVQIGETAIFLSQKVVILDENGEAAVPEVLTPGVTVGNVYTYANGKLTLVGDADDPTTTLTAVDNYYIEVTVGESKGFAPFKVVKKAQLGYDFDFIWNEATWNASSNGEGAGAMEIYHQQDPTADVWNPITGLPVWADPATDDNLELSWKGFIAQIGNNWATNGAAWVAFNQTNIAGGPEGNDVFRVVISYEEDGFGEDKSLYEPFDANNKTYQIYVGKKSAAPVVSGVTNITVLTASDFFAIEDYHPFSVSVDNDANSATFGRVGGAETAGDETMPAAFDRIDNFDFDKFSVQLYPAGDFASQDELAAAAEQLENYRWTMNPAKEKTYTAAAIVPTITVKADNVNNIEVTVPEYPLDGSGQPIADADPNYIVEYFTDEECTDEVPEMLHAGTYYVQVSRKVITLEEQAEVVGYEPIGVAKKFTIKQATLKMRLAQITPYFHQEEIYANYAIEDYKGEDDEDNVKIVNITYVEDPLADDETAEELGDRIDEWWDNEDFDWDAASKFPIRKIGSFEFANDLYEYTITGANAHAFIVDGGNLYEDYEVKLVTNAQADLKKNKVTVDIPEMVGKIYGDEDDFSLISVIDQDENVMNDEDDPYDDEVDVTVTISREKEGKYEDVGLYDIYVDITGEDAINYEVEDADDVEEIEGGFRYIFEERFPIYQYDITEAEVEEPKVIINIDDVVYDGTFQQVKPKSVWFLDVNGVFSAENTTNEYVAGTEAVEPTYYGPEDEEVISGEKAEGDLKTEGVAATPAYVILAEDIAAVPAVEPTYYEEGDPEVISGDKQIGDPKTEGSEGSDAIAGDWQLAFLRPDGKGTQKGVDSNTEYTYYYNRIVSRNADGSWAKIGECNITAVDDDDETDEVEGSINFYGTKTGYYAVTPRDLHVKVKAQTVEVGTEPTFTLEEVETEATNDGFVLDEKSNKMDTWNTSNVKLDNASGNVIYSYDATTMANKGTYTVTASLKDPVNRSKVAVNYNVIFDDNADNLIVVPQALAIIPNNQNGYFKVMSGAVEKNPAVAEDLADMHNGLNVYTYVRPTISQDAYVVKQGDAVAALPAGATVTLTTTGTKVGDGNVIKVSVDMTNVENPDNYTIDATATAKFIIAKNDEIHLSYGNVGQVLEDHKGQENVDVFLPKRNLFENVWTSLVLPFEVNVPELSNKLYYGLANTLNTEATDGNVHFVQEAGDIAANTPFIFKIGVKKNWDDESNSAMYASVKQAPAEGADPAVRMKGSYVASQWFEDVTIADGNDFTYNNNETAPYATDGTNKFYGVYNDYTATAEDWFLGVDGKFYGGSENEGKTVSAISGYVYRPGSASIAPRFFFDEDGVTTAIEGILDAAADADDADDAEFAAGSAAKGWYTINGIKLEGKPTVSGTYIFNGKKVYIK